jgi:hypothetical protein
MRFPNSKMNKARRYDHFISKSVYTRPYRGWNAAAVRRYEDPYHPTSAVELNSLVMRGIAYRKESVD